VRVAESSVATREIAKEIVVVDRAAEQMAEGSWQVRNSASELSNVAEHPLQAMSKFQV
jgi:methyl-accepting chemotaxis protein